MKILNKGIVLMAALGCIVWPDSSLRAESQDVDSGDVRTMEQQSFEDEPSVCQGQCGELEMSSNINRTPGFSDSTNPEDYPEALQMLELRNTHTETAPDLN